jgi:hypothetical protein
MVFVTVAPSLVCENNPYTKGYGKDGEVPLVPAVPAIPAVPLTPELPDSPLVPDEPLSPEVPLIPLVPDSPEVPDVPTTPLVPDVPDKPVTPLVPDVPDPPPPALYATPFIASNCLEICHKRFSSVPHPICLLGIAMIAKINVQRYVTF